MRQRRGPLNNNIRGRVISGIIQRRHLRIEAAIARDDRDKAANIKQVLADVRMGLADKVLVHTLIGVYWPTLKFEPKVRHLGAAI
jgi:hypothetical protein